MNVELRIKKNGILLFVICYLLAVAVPKAQAVTPTPAPTTKPTTTNENLGEKINDLKERIASRVAQLKLVERRGIVGKVTDVANTQITILDVSNNIRFIDVDEITKFASPSAKGTFGISDIPKGITIGVLGLYNKESRRTLARFVNTLSLPIMLHGAVASVNSEDFSFVVTTPDKFDYIVDIEKTTRTLIYTKEAGTVKAGFAKIKEGKRVSIVGYAADKNPSRISALKVIVFQDVPRNPAIIFSVSPTSSPTATLAPKKSVQ